MFLIDNAGLGVQYTALVSLRCWHCCERYGEIPAEAWNPLVNFSAFRATKAHFFLNLLAEILAPNIDAGIDYQATRF